MWLGRPIATVRAELRPSAGPLLVGWWVGTLVLGLLAAAVTPLPVEVRLLAAVAGERTDALVRAARVASTLGDLEVVALLAAVAVVALRRHTAAARLTVLLLVSFVGSTLSIGVLKLLTDRGRPDGGLVEAWSSAYPSGHAGRAAAVYGLLVWAAARSPGRWPQRLGLVLATTALAGAIAVSRVYLGVHWPSDVLVGLLLGSLWLAVSLRCTRPVRPTHGRPDP